MKNRNGLDWARIIILAMTVAGFFALWFLMIVAKMLYLTYAARMVW